MIQDRANEIIRAGMRDVKRMSYAKAMKVDTTQEYDYIMPYVSDLRHVIDMETIAGAGRFKGIHRENTGADFFAVGKSHGPFRTKLIDDNRGPGSC